MKFKKLETTRYHRNLNKVFKNSQNSYTERFGCIIKLYFDNYCGCGESSPLPFFSIENIKQVEWAIEELKAGLVVNQKYSKKELLTIFEVFSKKCPSLNFALDVALYDILSQRENLPLSKYLNKNAIQKINFSAIGLDKAPMDSSIKIKFGVEDVNEDIKAINNISKKYPHVSLRIDFNRLCDLKEAIFICNELKECNIEYIEEPLKFPLEKDYTQLKNSIQFPIALDESIIDGSYKHLIDLNLIDYAILKPALFGGIKKINQLNLYLKKYKVRLIISSSLQEKIGNFAEINLASSLELSSQHGLNNYAFFDNKYDVPYNKNDLSINLDRLVGLGVCWND